MHCSDDRAHVPGRILRSSQLDRKIQHSSKSTHHIPLAGKTSGIFTDCSVSVPIVGAVLVAASLGCSGNRWVWVTEGQKMQLVVFAIFPASVAAAADASGGVPTLVQFLVLTLLLLH